MKSATVLVVTLVTCTSSCSSEDKTCAPGATQACVCPSGRQGAQACSPDGTGWGTCTCEGAPDAGADSVTPDGKPPPSDQTSPDGVPCAKKPETCNGLDDDCNGIVDDMPAGTPSAHHLFRDADGDGFGVTASIAWLCQKLPGWSDKGGDCDDKRKDVNPGMTEVCGDGVDHDCDGVKEDGDICGLTPATVPDANEPISLGTILKTCGATATPPALDVLELAAKQDNSQVRFTARLAGSPSVMTCASYVLHLGTSGKVYEAAYIYRPGAPCGGGLAKLEVFVKGVKLNTGATASFETSTPGSVSFLVPKSEWFPSLSTPSYFLKVCTNAVADAFKDLTDCASDSCEAPVHR